MFVSGYYTYRGVGLYGIISAAVCSICLDACLLLLVTGWLSYILRARHLSSGQWLAFTVGLLACRCRE